MTEHSLSAPHFIEYDYTRSLGAVLSRFVTGLRDGVVKGMRTSSGKVVVPPTEFDPDTYEDLGPDSLVDVADAGVVTSWAWVGEPRASHPFDRPFAWALVRLDGADTDLLHALDAGSEDEVTTGMRVRIRWATERSGGIRDIECFEAEEAG
jgi:uncharacterized OB-fold protein